MIIREPTEAQTNYFHMMLNRVRKGCISKREFQALTRLESSVGLINPNARAYPWSLKRAI